MLMMLALISPRTRLMLMMLVSGGGWLLTLFDLRGLFGVGWCGVGRWGGVVGWFGLGGGGVWWVMGGGDDAGFVGVTIINTYIYIHCLFTLLVWFSGAGHQSCSWRQYSRDRNLGQACGTKLF